jgi:hypothetical protein
MASNAGTQQPDGAGRPPGAVAYDKRLATTIPRAVDQRLPPLRDPVRKPLAHVLSDVLALALPPTPSWQQLHQRGAGPMSTPCDRRWRLPGTASVIITKWGSTGRGSAPRIR